MFFWYSIRARAGDSADAEVDRDFHRPPIFIAISNIQGASKSLPLRGQNQTDLICTSPGKTAGRFFNSAAIGVEFVLRGPFQNSFALERTLLETSDDPAFRSLKHNFGKGCACTSKG